MVQNHAGLLNAVLCVCADVSILPRGGDLDNDGCFGAVVPNGVRGHAVHKYRLVFAGNDLFIAGDDAHFTIDDDENMVIAVGVIIFRAATVFSI